MACRATIDRVNAICAELMDIVDAEREGCDNDECELINCVVHDCVQKMKRVLAECEPKGQVEAEIHPLKLSNKINRRVN